MADDRFPSPGLDARFPSPGIDIEHENFPEDGRFPSPGVDARFDGSGYGDPLEITMPTLNPALTNGEYKVGTLYSAVGGDATDPDGGALTISPGIAVDGGLGGIPSYTMADGDYGKQGSVSMHVSVTSGPNAGFERTYYADQGLITAAAPVAADNLAAQNFTVGTGNQTYDTSGDFTGLQMRYSLASAPAGVSINATTGVVTHPTTFAYSGQVTVRATNLDGSAESSYDVEVAVVPVLAQVVTGNITGTTASWVAQTDTAGGTIFAAARLSSDPVLTLSEIENGTGNAVSTSQDTSVSVGISNGGDFTGLSYPNNYVVDAFQRGPTGLESSVTSSAAFDTVDTSSPVVTAVLHSVAGSDGTTATWSCTSDDPTGTIFAAVRLSTGGALTQDQIENGGSGVLAQSQDDSPTADDQNGGSFSGLTLGTSYRVDVFQRDGASNVGVVSTSALVLTTPATPVNTQLPEITPTSGQANATLFTYVAGVWADNPSPTVNHEWVMNGTPTGSSAPVYSSPATGSLTVRETANNGAGGDVVANSLPVTVTAQVPVWTDQPEITPSVAVVGQVYTIETGTATAADSYSIASFTVGGVDRSGELSGTGPWAWDSTGDTSAATISARVRATSSTGGTADSNNVTATLNTVPKITSIDWGPQDGPDGDIPAWINGLTENSNWSWAISTGSTMTAADIRSGTGATANGTVDLTTSAPSTPIDYGSATGVHWLHMVLTTGDDVVHNSANSVDIQGAVSSGITPVYLGAAPSSDLTTDETTKTFTVDTSAHSGTDPVYICVGAHARWGGVTLTSLTIDGQNAPLVTGTDEDSGTTYRPVSSVFKLTGYSLPASSTVVVTASGGTPTVVSAGCSVFSAPGATSEAGFKTDNGGAGSLTLDFDQNVAAGDGVVCCTQCRDSTVVSEVGVTERSQLDLGSGESFFSADAAEVVAATPRAMSVTGSSSQVKSTSGVVIS